MGSVSSYLPLAEDYVFYIHSIFSLAVSMNREKKCTELLMADQLSSIIARSVFVHFIIRIQMK